MGSGRQTVHEGETMILVLGGTTEGRLTAGLLDELRMPFIYSTKTPVEPFATSYGFFAMVRFWNQLLAAFSQLTTSQRSLMLRTPLRLVFTG